MGIEHSRYGQKEKGRRGDKRGGGHGSPWGKKERLSQKGKMVGPLQSGREEGEARSQVRV